MMDTHRAHRLNVYRLLFLKRFAHKQDAAMAQCRDGIRHFKRCLRQWSKVDKATRLANGIPRLERECQAKLANWEKQLEGFWAQKEALQEVLVDCMMTYDRSPHKSRHEMAQLLGISHVALDSFLNSERGKHMNGDDAARLSTLAFMHAEVAFERACERAGCIFETPSRKVTLFHAMQHAMMRAMKENPAFRYQTDRHMAEMFPGFPVRPPERNFRVVDGGAQ